jgi:hypothetical protein
VRIGPIVKKKQPIFEIQDGGSRYLGLQELCILNITVEFYGIFPTFSPNLVTICLRVMKWIPLFEIRDGGRRHLEFL